MRGVRSTDAAFVLPAVAAGRHSSPLGRLQPLDCPRCGMTLDVGLAQIIAGLAWWFRRYADEQSPQDRGRYESEEKEARLRKRGLWADGAPVPP